MPVTQLCADDMSSPSKQVQYHLLHNSELDVSTDKATFESTHRWVQALTEALTSGHLGGAGLDVHWVVCFFGHECPEVGFAIRLVSLISASQVT